MFFFRTFGSIPNTRGLFFVFRVVSVLGDREILLQTLLLVPHLTMKHIINVYDIQTIFMPSTILDVFFSSYKSHKTNRKSVENQKEIISMFLFGPTDKPSVFNKNSNRKKNRISNKNYAPNTNPTINGCFICVAVSQPNKLSDPLQ